MPNYKPFGHSSTELGAQGFNHVLGPNEKIRILYKNFAGGTTEKSMEVMGTGVDYQVSNDIDFIAMILVAHVNTTAGTISIGSSTSVDTAASFGAVLNGRDGKTVLQMVLNYKFLTGTYVNILPSTTQVLSVTIIGYETPS